MKPSSVYITVDDMSRAIDFYEKLFQREANTKEDRYSSFQFDNFAFDLFASAEDEEERIMGNSTIPVFISENLKADKERIISLGCPILFEQEIDNYNIIQFKDSEENTLEIYEKTPNS